MGHNSDNLLGFEWVTPEGEVLKIGSLNSTGKWFCSEGPGPSVRGMNRGVMGSRGGLGVYTKCAIKLSPWTGPAKMDVQGTIPAYRLPIPENHRVYTIAVSTWDAWADCYSRFMTRIGYINSTGSSTLRYGNLAPAFWLMYNDHTKTLNDVETMGRIRKSRR
jgi:hypothetical protein